MKNLKRTLFVVAMVTCGFMLEVNACPADFDGNGSVGFADLSALLAAWGPCTSSTCPADMDGNGSVGFADLSALLAAWGPCPDPVCPFECADMFGCLFSGGIFHEDYPCEGENTVCCETVILPECPYTCDNNPFSCDQGQGTMHDGYSCPSDGFCCEYPQLPACPYSCVSDDFFCLLNNGTTHNSYSCEPAGTCCELP